MTAPHGRNPGGPEHHAAHDAARDAGRDAARATGTEEARRAQAQVGMFVASAGVVALGVLLAGLLAHAAHIDGANTMLRSGCGVLLAIPLVRNGAVFVLDRRRSVKNLAALVTVALAALYAIAVSRITE